MTQSHITEAHYLPLANPLVSRLSIRLSSGLVHRLVVRAASAPLARTLVGKTLAQLCTQLYDGVWAHPSFCDCTDCLDEQANEQALEDHTERLWEAWNREHTVGT